MVNVRGFGTILWECSASYSTSILAGRSVPSARELRKFPAIFYRFWFGMSLHLKVNNWYLTRAEGSCVMYHVRTFRRVQTDHNQHFGIRMTMYLGRALSWPSRRSPLSLPSHICSSTETHQGSILSSSFGLPPNVTSNEIDECSLA